MYPWLWFMAPQFHFPFSGSVAQRIDPDTSWFFSGIRPQAGDGALEKNIFDVASYGRQLGLISEVLLAQAGSDAVSAEQGAQSLARLEAVHRQIEAVKAQSRDELAGAATAALAQLQASDPAALARVLKRFAPPALKKGTLS